jgi:hypothetical protein
MRTFIASMSYDLVPETSPVARKLLRAELVGRRWKDRVRDRLMPASCLWIERSAGEDDTAADVHDRCAEDLRDAARAVAAAGLAIVVLRAFIQVAGGGSYGLAPEGFFDPSEEG